MCNKQFWRAIRDVIAAWVLVQVISGTAAIAADRPVLVVPRCSTALQIALPLPGGAKVDATAAWQLVEEGQGGVAVPAQLLPVAASDGSIVDGQYRVVATLPADKCAKATEVRQFLLHSVNAGSQGKSGFTFIDVDRNSVKVNDGDKPVLVYNHGIITGTKVPKDNPERERSCYVHPVWGIDGEVLTDDFPQDHFHHHGLFWAWPHVRIGGKEYDIWTYHDIHDRFVRWICREGGPACAQLAVENGWFVGGKKVMTERVWLRSYAVSDAARVLDLEFTWIPVDQPVTLRSSDNSYGGLTMRFAVNELKETQILTPNGRADTDQERVRLPWADLTYPFAGGGTRSGAALFVDPGHPSYPPTWLLRHFGPLCIGYPGVTEKTFQPNQPIRLNYRVWIHKGSVDVGQLQRAYDAYSVAGKVRWE